jgi:hypothetical protein
MRTLRGEGVGRVSREQTFVREKTGEAHGTETGSGTSQKLAAGEEIPESVSLCHHLYSTQSDGGMSRVVPQNQDSNSRSRFSKQKVIRKIAEIRPLQLGVNVEMEGVGTFNGFPGQLDEFLKKPIGQFRSILVFVVGENLV